MPGPWDTMTPYHVLGVRPAFVADRSLAGNITPGIGRSAGPAAAAPHAAPSPLSPESPLFWFGCLALVTFGAVAFSTSIRVGPARGSLGLGKT